MKAVTSEGSAVGRQLGEKLSAQRSTSSREGKAFGRGADRLSEMSSKARQLTDEITEKVSDSSAGKRAGAGVRKIGGAVSQAPIFSAAVDGIRAKNCVDVLAERLVADPANAYCSIWLAESLIQTERDMTAYLRIKGVVDPTSFLASATLRSAAKVGNDSLPTKEKLLRNAWRLAGDDLKANPRNSSALDVLARVYLAKGDYTRSISTAEVGWLADVNDARPLVTAGRALISADCAGAAREAGARAVEVGSTVGFLIVAEAEQLIGFDRSDEGLRSRVKKYEELATAVTRPDKVNYYGADRDSQETLKATLESQREKGAQVWSQAKRLGRIIRDA